MIGTRVCIGISGRIHNKSCMRNKGMKIDYGAIIGKCIEIASITKTKISIIK